MKKNAEEKLRKNGRRRKMKRRKKSKYFLGCFILVPIIFIFA